jgi:undecaprenyl-diphosphatase
MDIFQSIVIAIIEGITEFLPVSSTGHMILASSIMKIQDADFVKTFEISIQLGAILAIVMLYTKRFLQGFTIYLKLSTAFLPTAVIGFLAYDFIKTHLFNSTVAATIIGGVFNGLDKKQAKIQNFKIHIISYSDTFYTICRSLFL